MIICLLRLATLTTSAVIVSQVTVLQSYTCKVDSLVAQQFRENVTEKYKI